MSPSRVGRPSPARCAASRAVSSAGQSSTRSDRRIASTMPSATDSPCSSRSPNPVSVSSAWPKVWPKFKCARTPALALVGADDGRLGDAAVMHPDGARLAIAVDHRPPVRLEPLEHRAIADHGMLEHLGIAGAQLARGQAVEAAGVGEHQLGLVEGADQILAGRGIDPGLAADRAVDLGEQGWSAAGRNPARASRCSRRSRPGRRSRRRRTPAPACPDRS